MNWNPFNRTKKVDDTEVTKERLLKWREELMKSAYAIRVFDKAASHYLFSVAATDKDKAIRKLLGAAVCDQLVNQSKMWGTIGDIEYILTKKYGLALLDPINVHDMMIEQLEAEIDRLQAK
jgi:hypothetical protein